jgi:hypothetical protein
MERIYLAALIRNLTPTCAPTPHSFGKLRTGSQGGKGPDREETPILDPSLVRSGGAEEPRWQVVVIKGRTSSVSPSSCTFSHQWRRNFLGSRQSFQKDIISTYTPRSGGKRSEGRLGKSVCGPLWVADRGGKG